MSRPMLLVFLLIILIITSQFEWKQQLVAEVDTDTSAISQKQPQLSNREEAVKEKIILSQERNIQRLNEVVRNLREQLQQCRASNITNGTTMLSGRILELERLHVLED